MQSLLPLLLAFSAQPSSNPTVLAPSTQELDLQELDLKGALDQSVRWLRSKQDPRTGAYGGAFEPTAWTLLAFARSPRQYRAQDGPFVQGALDFLLGHASDDGAIHAPDASPEERLAQTELAAIVLGHHVTPGERAHPIERPGLVWAAGWGRRRATT